MVALPVYLIYNTGIRMEGAGMMKRLLKYTALVLVILSVFVCSGSAEGIDISSLSDDELIAISETVSQEMSARELLDLPVIPIGTYIVGEDIKEGNYCITGKGRETILVVHTVESYEAFVENGYSAADVPEARGETLRISSGDKGYVSLDVGYVLRVAYSGYIEEADESWMP